MRSSAKGSDKFPIKENTTLYAQWKANSSTPYTVEHYLSNAEGVYPSEPQESVLKYGVTDGKITSSTLKKTYLGYTYDHANPETATINADGRTVIRLYYKENPEVTISYRTEDNMKGTVTPTGESVRPMTGNPKGSTATPGVDYAFVNWTTTVGREEQEVSTDATLTKDAIDRFAKGADGLYKATTFTAHFARKTQEVTVKKVWNESGLVDVTHDAITLTFTPNVESVPVVKVSLSSERDWTAEAILCRNVAYTVTESDVGTAYDMTLAAEPASAVNGTTVTAVEGLKTITVTNTRGTGHLDISKRVHTADGNPVGGEGDRFFFTVEAVDGRLKDGMKFQLQNTENNDDNTVENGKLNVILVNGIGAPMSGNHTISNLPVGTYKITEYQYGTTPIQSTSKYQTPKWWLGGEPEKSSSTGLKIDPQEGSTSGYSYEVEVTGTEDVPYVCVLNKWNNASTLTIQKKAEPDTGATFNFEVTVPGADESEKRSKIKVVTSAGISADWEDKWSRKLIIRDVPNNGWIKITNIDGSVTVQETNGNEYSTAYSWTDGATTGYAIGKRATIDLSPSAHGDIGVNATLTFTNTLALGGLTIDKTVQTSDGTMDTANSEPFTFTVTPSAGITIPADYVKANKLTGVELANNKLIVTLTTAKGQGSITLPKLPAGSYTVAEDAKPQYVTTVGGNLGNEKTVEVPKGGQAVQVSFVNKLSTAKLTIMKTTDVPQDATQFTMTVYSDEACANQVGESVTVIANDGKGATVSDLVIGQTYYVQETQQSGWYVPELVRPVTIKATDNVVTFENKAQTGSFTIRKTYDGAEPAPEATQPRFTLYTDADCTIPYSDEYKDVAVGKELTGLPIGTYYLKETTVPDGYEEALVVVITVEGNTGNTADATVTATNLQEDESILNTLKTDGSLKITKTVLPASEDTFNFTVELTSAKKSFDVKIGETTYTAKDGTLIIEDISLGNGDAIVITGIPYGTAYKVNETAREGYTSYPKDGAQGTVTDGQETAAFTNAIVDPMNLSISGQKTWNDAGNYASKRPDSVMVTLQRSTDGETWSDVGTAELQTSNWTYSFTDLPKYAYTPENGTPTEVKEYAYRVVETQVAGYQAPVYSTKDGVAAFDKDGAAVVNVTNTLSPVTIGSVSATKEWRQSTVVKGTPGATLTLQRKTDAKDAPWVDVATATLPVQEDGSASQTANDWTFANGKQLNLFYTDNGTVKAYAYRVMEMIVPTGYIASPFVTAMKYDAETGDLTGEKNIVNSRLEGSAITVTKTWTDGGGEDEQGSSTRPESITITVMDPTGKDTLATYELKATEDWKYRFENLPTYEEPYVVLESDVKGYTYTTGTTSGVITHANVNVTGSDYTINNRRDTGKTSLTLTKTWAGEVEGIDTRPQSLTVKVQGSNGEIEYKLVKKLSTPAVQNEIQVTEAGNTWTATIENLPKYDANGALITYAVTEVCPANYSNTQDDVFTQGSGEHFYSYSLTNTLQTQSVAVEKLWEDEGNAYGLRPQSVTVDVMSGDTKVRTGVELTDEAWTKEITLPTRGADGEPIAYRLTEIAPKGYTASTTVGAEIIGENAKLSITNTLNTREIELAKTWQTKYDEKGSAIEGAPAATFGLYYGADAESLTPVLKNGAPVTATSGKDGAVKFTGVPSVWFEGDTDYQYFLKEEGVSDGHYAVSQAPIEVGTEPLALKNELKTGSLTIEKTVDWKNTAVEAMDFVIGYTYFVEKDDVQTKVTGEITAKVAANGDVTYAREGVTENANTITGIPYGTKVDVKELRAVVGGTTDSSLAAWTVTGDTVKEITADSDTVTITNTRNVTNTPITVTKQWQTSEAGTPGATLYLERSTDGTKWERVTSAMAAGYADQVLEPQPDTTANQTATFAAGLPTHDAAGKAYTYRVNEEAVEGYVTNAPQTIINAAATITNTRNEDTKVEVTKQWITTEAAGNLPDVTFTVMRRVGEAADTSYSAQVELAYNEATNSGYIWKATLKDVPGFDENGRAYTYYVDSEAATDAADAAKLALYTASGLNTLTVTNTLTQVSNLSIEGKKTWIDTNTEARTDITVTLQRRHSEMAEDEWETVGQPQTVPLSDGMAYRFENLDKYAYVEVGGVKVARAYTYRVVETPVAGYQAPVYSTEGGVAAFDENNAAVVNITNVIEQTNDVSVRARKEWVDSTENAIRVPVNAQLRSDEAAANTQADVTGKTFTLAAGNDPAWTAAIADLPRYAYTEENGKITGVREIAYTVKESAVPDGYTADNEGVGVVDESDVHVITNRIAAGEMTPSITKTWNVPAYVTVPATATFELWRKLGADGTYERFGTETATLTYPDTTVVIPESWKKLPLNDTDSGKQYTYKVVEKAPANYTASPEEVVLTAEKQYQAAFRNSIDISKSLTISKTVDYKAALADETGETLNPDFKFTLYYVEGEKLTQVVSPFTLKGGKSTTFTGLPVGTYRIVETVLHGWAAEASSIDVTLTKDSEGSAAFTNKRNLAESITVEKVWLDGDNALNTRPNSLALVLKGFAGEKEVYSAPVTLTEKGGWKMEISGLPKTHTDGSAIEYELVEEQVPAVENDELVGVASYEQLQDTNPLTVTNRLTGEQKATFTKTWADDDNVTGVRPNWENFKSKLKVWANGTEMEEQPELVPTDTAASLWTFQTAQELPLFDSDGKKIPYTLNEAEIDGYTCTQNDSAALKNTLKTVDLTITKVVVDAADNSDSQNKAFTISYSYEKSDGKTATESVKLTGAGKPVTVTVPYGANVTVEETAVPGWTTTYTDGTKLKDNKLGSLTADASITVVNTRDTASVTAAKAWASNVPEADRVDVEMVLERKIGTAKAWTKVGAQTIKKDANPATCTWSGLPTHDVDGNAYTYRVVETKIDSTFKAPAYKVGEAQTNEVMRRRIIP